MKHIAITGRPGTGKIRRARELYHQHTGDGQHVLFDVPGQWLNSLPERSMAKADVLITVRRADGPITETTTL